jgi:hypothetical protein
MLDRLCSTYIPPTMNSSRQMASAQREKMKMEDESGVTTFPT